MSFPHINDFADFAEACRSADEIKAAPVMAVLAIAQELARLANAAERIADALADDTLLHVNVAGRPATGAERIAAVLERWDDSGAVPIEQVGP